MKNILMPILTLLIASSPAIAENFPSTSAVDAQKDSLISDHKVILIDGKPQVSRDILQNDSIRELIDNFFYDQFTSFSDPAAPYFLFMSRDADLMMGIGGCVRIRAWYDVNAALPVNSFTPYFIPLTKDPANNSKLGATPAGSTIFFRVIGRNKLLGNYQLYIEGNFNGYGGTDFHLKKAYAQINRVTIGYASSTFSDPSALPPTVDANGPSNKISGTSVLVRWMNTYRKRWTVAASEELPRSININTVEGKIGKASQSVPDFAAFLQYAWGRSEHVRLSGLLRTLPYQDLVTDKKHSKLGRGVQLSAVAHPLYPLTVYATLNCGKGHASTTADLQAGDYDLISRDDNPRDMYAPLAYGWCLGLQYNFLPDLFASLSVSESRYLPDKPRPADEYRRGNILSANIFWNLTPRIQAGAEFDTGIRKNWSGESRRANRIGLMAQFSF